MQLADSTLRRAENGLWWDLSLSAGAGRASIPCPAASMDVWDRTASVGIE